MKQRYLRHESYDRKEKRFEMGRPVWAGSGQANDPVGNRGQGNRGQVLYALSPCRTFEKRESSKLKPINITGFPTSNETIEIVEH